MEAQLRLILGDGLSDAALSSLLRQHSSLEAAVDAFFSQQDQTSSPPDLPRPASSQDLPPSQPPPLNDAPAFDGGWPRLLGSCSIVGTSLVREGEVAALVPGEPLEIVLPPPPAAATAAAGGRPAKPRRADEAVRFRRPGRDPADRMHPLAEAPLIGRLPLSVGRALLPPLRAAALHVVARVGVGRCTLVPGGSVPLELQLRAERGDRGIAAAPDTVRGERVALWRRRR